VNRKDKGGNGVFEGGFLGLDNIGAFNRSEPLPTGGELRQADGTAWMAFYCLNMSANISPQSSASMLTVAQVEYGAGTREAQPSLRGYRIQVLRGRIIICNVVSLPY
jgi:hypothetical protein